MSPFGQLLFETAKACEGRSAVVLDRVLTAKVRAYADQQASDAQDWSVAIEAAKPFEVA
jgi:hypothetical protein